jgi:hypothetical protein
MQEKFELGIEGSGAIIKKCTQRYGNYGIDICFKNYESFDKFAKKQSAAVKSEYCMIICSLSLEAASRIYKRPNASFDVSAWQKIANQSQPVSSLHNSLGIEGSNATVKGNDKAGIDIIFKDFKSFKKFSKNQLSSMDSEYYSLTCSLTLEAASLIYSRPNAYFNPQEWQRIADIEPELENTSISRQVIR